MPPWQAASVAAPSPRRGRPSQASFSLFPLLKKDGLVLPYAACVLGFAMLAATPPPKGATWTRLLHRASRWGTGPEKGLKAAGRGRGGGGGGGEVCPLLLLMPRNSPRPSGAVGLPWQRGRICTRYSPYESNVQRGCRVS